MALDLNPQRGLLFRITHVANLPWFLANGLHCANGAAADPNFVAIGNPDLIDKRAHRRVLIPPSALLGIGCVSEAMRRILEASVQATSSALQVFVRPGWYF